MRRPTLDRQIAMNPKYKEYQTIFLALFLLCLLLWLPFGFRLGALIEEWGVLGVFKTSGPIFFITADTPLAAHRLRPLTIFPHALAYALDKNSFFFWHILLIFSVFLKGVGGALIGRTVTGSLRWGIALGILVAIYPADTMQLAFRGLHINWSVSMFLLGCAMLMFAQDAGKNGTRLALAASAAICFVMAELMYEVAFALLLAPFILLFARDGVGKSLRGLRSNFIPTLAWLAAGLSYCIYVVSRPAMSDASYQATLTSGQPPLATLYAAAPYLFDPALTRGLIGGWVDSWGMLATGFKSYYYIGFFAIALFLFFGLAQRQDQRRFISTPIREKRSAAFLLRLAFAGLILLICGFLPYLFSPAHIVITQRTYLFASPGAALVLLAMLIGIESVSKWLAKLFLLLLIILGIGSQIYQFNHYVEISENQRRILKTIVENFDGQVDGKTLLILDESQQLGHTWFLRDNLGPALTYLYDKPVPSVEICLGANRAWQRWDAYARTGTCVEGNDSWTLISPHPTSGPGTLPSQSLPDRVMPKSQIISIHIKKDGSIDSTSELDGYRRALESNNDAAALRYRNILRRPSSLPNFNLFRDTASLPTYRWDFGKWWSLEIPIRGTGWREAEWAGKLFRHDAAAWKTQSQSSLLFDFTPVSGSYSMRGNFKGMLNDTIKSSFQLKINGQEIAYRWKENGDFDAVIPDGVVAKGTNTAEFNFTVDPSYFDLSAQLKWFDLRPL